MATNDTKEKIADALVRLGMNQDPGSITVRQLSEECGISRQTFYYHFEDIPAVCEYVLRRDLKAYSAAALQAPDAQSAAEAFVGGILDNLPMFARGLRSRLRPEVEKMTLDASRDCVQDLIARSLPDVPMSARDVSFLADLLACSILGEVISCVAGGTIDVKEYCRQLVLLVHARIGERG